MMISAGMRVPGPYFVTLRRCDVVPLTAVLVVRDHDHHMRPLRARLELGHEVGDVQVSVIDVRVAGVLVVVALWLVVDDLRQRAGRDVCHQVVVVLQMRGSRIGVQRGVERRVVVVRLVMGLEVRRCSRRGRRVDHRARGGAGLHAVRGGRGPGARVPGPAHALLCQHVADGGLRLRRHRRVRGSVGVAQVNRVRDRRVAARLIRRLHGVDRSVAVTGSEVVERRDVAGHEVGRAVERRSRRAGVGGELRHALGVGRTKHVDRRQVTGNPRHRQARRAGADQVLMVQERAAVRRLEEVVGQDVVLGQLVHLGCAVIEVPHVVIPPCIQERREHMCRSCRR